MTTGRRLLVRGRVQGVFYRDACRREADRLGVHGWARNLDDGSVEVVMAGEPDALDALEGWCRSGPPRALVTSIESHPSAAEVVPGFGTR